MKTEDKLFLSRILLILRLTGLDPTQRNIRKNKTLLIILGLVIWQLTSSTAELLINYKGVETLARYSEVSIGIYTVIWRIPYTMIKSKQMAKLLQGTFYFWPIDLLGDRFNKEVAFPIYSARLLSQFMLSLVSVLAVMYGLAPALLNTGFLPWMSYGDSNNYRYISYWLLYSIQIISMPIIVAISFGFDWLFYYLIAKADTEMKIVSKVFSSEEFGHLKWDRKERFRKAVRHHAFVLEYIKCLNDTYSLMLLNQYLCSQVSICMCMFLLTSDGFPPPALLFKYIVLICSYTTQISIFCFMGNNLTFESDTVFTAVFHNIWNTENFDHIDRNNLLMVIQRSQRMDCITIGGFFKLDLTSLNKLLKQALSILTCLQAVNNR